jgi:hypothetical protein
MLMVARFGLPPVILQPRDLDEPAVNPAFWTMTALGVVFVGLTALIAEPLSAF